MFCHSDLNFILITLCFALYAIRSVVSAMLSEDHQWPRSFASAETFHKTFCRDISIQLKDVFLFFMNGRLLSYKYWILASILKSDMEAYVLVTIMKTSLAADTKYDIYYYKRHNERRVPFGIKSVVHLNSCGYD